MVASCAWPSSETATPTTIVRRNRRGLWARSGTGVTARLRGKPMGLALEGPLADLTLPQPTSESKLVRVTHR
jgi:hypothetical protein